MATGAVYYHRFYMFHAFQDFNRYVVSTCCLFLAGKAEETPKKCKDIRKIWIYIDEKFSQRKIICTKIDIILFVFSVRTVRQLTNDRQFAFFGADPREEIMVLERGIFR